MLQSWPIVRTGFDINMGNQAIDEKTQHVILLEDAGLLNSIVNMEFRPKSEEGMPDDNHVNIEYIQANEFDLD